MEKHKYYKYVQSLEDEERVNKMKLKTHRRVMVEKLLKKSLSDPFYTFELSCRGLFADDKKEIFCKITVDKPGRHKKAFSIKATPSGFRVTEVGCGGELYLMNIESVLKYIEEET